MGIGLSRPGGRDAQGPGNKFPETVDFSSNALADAVTLTNWSFPEPTGRWTNGNTASVRLYVGKAEAHDLLLTFDLNPYVVALHPQQVVNVSINGAPLAAWKFSDGSPATEQILISNQLLREANGAVVVSFDLPDAVMPKQLGLGGDDRKLGIFVRKIAIDEAK
jgi:hypothetical protein